MIYNANKVLWEVYRQRYGIAWVYEASMVDLLEPSSGSTQLKVNFVIPAQYWEVNTFTEFYSLFTLQKGEWEMQMYFGALLRNGDLPFVHSFSSSPYKILGLSLERVFR